MHSASIMLLDTIPARGIPQRAIYVAFIIEKHDKEPIIYLIIGSNASVFCNVLHTEPQPNIATKTKGDNVYLLDKHFRIVIGF